MDILELQVEAWKIAEEKGWHAIERTIGDLLALVHSEISEALEEYRKDKNPRLTYFRGTKPEGFGIELADAIIRICEMAEGLSIDLATLVQVKMDYNRTREHRHGGKAI